MEQVPTAFFDQIIKKSYKWKCVELYHFALMKAMKDILNDEEKPYSQNTKT